MKIGKYEIELPPGHALEQICVSQPTYDFLQWNIIREIFYSNGIREPGLIDIGANVGDTIAHHRRFSSGKCVGVEPSSSFFELLEKNTDQFDGVELVKAIVSPRDLFDKVQFSAGSQTGSTVLSGQDIDSDKNTARIAIGDLLQKIEGPLLVKSDTDGFDGYIIADLAKEIKVSSRLVELISFEGPGEKQIPSGDYEEYLSAMNQLMVMGYKILILTNIGFPVANVGNDFEQIVWHMNNLQLQHCAGRAMCHYFDFIAVSPKLSTEVFNFDGKTRNRIFDELYGSQ